jgi:chromosome segregation ATPase
MNRGKWIIVLVLILLAASVSAEIFKYVDQDGNVLYTDDLSVIPAAQRSDVEVFSQTADKAHAAPEAAVQQSKQTETTKADDSEELSVRLEKQRTALAREGEALEEEIQALKKEKEAFFSSRRFKSGTDSRITRQLKELNKKIAASNKKLEKFEKKKAAYEAEMKAIQGE